VGKKEKIRQLLTISKPELEVLKYFCTGEPNKKISKELFMAEGTIRSHMRTIYIKLALYGYSTTKRRFIVIKEYCHLLCDPEYLKALEEGVKDIDKEGKALIVIEPDEERDRDVDDMIKEDSKYWPMIIPVNEAEVLPPTDIVPVNDPTRRKASSFQLILFIFALIGFAAVAIFGYELITGRLNIFQSEVVSQSQPVTQEDELSPPEAEQAEKTEVIVPTAIPTSAEIIPTESPTYTPPTPPKPTVLFENNFDLGLSEAWEIVLGNPIVVNGMLSADQDTWLIVGDPTWTNYSVEFKADSKYVYFDWGANFAAVRLVDMENMYAYEWVDAESRCHVVENGNWNEVPQSGFRAGADFIQIKITAIDDLITIYVDGIKKASFFDKKFTQGRVGLMLTEETLIDDFKVREILE